MFEQEYKKMFRDVKPSAELEAETLGLLLEMRDHSPAEPAPRRNLKPVFITAAASVAAVFLLTFIGVGFYRGVLVKRMDAEFDFSDESTLEDEDLFGTDEVENQESDQDSEKESSDEATEEREDISAVADDGKDGSRGEKTDSSDGEGSSVMDGDSADEDESSDQELAPEEPESNGVLWEEYSEEYKDSSTDVDLVALSEPKTINTAGIRTYLSIKEFADALEKRSTLGYGTKYYNARELLIVPSALPEHCTFRQLYLNTKTGAYSYQYTIPSSELYYLTIENQSARASSLQQLKEQISYLEGEEVTVTRQGNTVIYTFGTETVTATLTVAATGSSDIPQDVCDRFFGALELTRSTLDNQLIDMTYGNQ